MGYRSVQPINRSHLRLIQGEAPPPERPGLRNRDRLRAIREARQREERIKEADRAIRDAWVVGTHNLPGRADRDTEDYRRGRRSSWRGQLNGGTTSIWRAAALPESGPITDQDIDAAIARVRRTEEYLLRGYGTYQVVFSDTAEEAIAVLESLRSTPAPSAPALKAAA